MVNEDDIRFLEKNYQKIADYDCLDRYIEFLERNKELYYHATSDLIKKATKVGALLLEKNADRLYSYGEQIYRYHQEGIQKIFDEGITSNHQARMYEHMHGHKADIAMRLYYVKQDKIWVIKSQDSLKEALKIENKDKEYLSTLANNICEFLTNSAQNTLANQKIINYEVIYQGSKYCIENSEKYNQINKCLERISNIARKRVEETNSLESKIKWLDRGYVASEKQVMLAMANNYKINPQNLFCALNDLYDLTLEIGIHKNIFSNMPDDFSIPKEKKIKENIHSIYTQRLIDSARIIGLNLAVNSRETQAYQLMWDSQKKISSEMFLTKEIDLTNKSYELISLSAAIAEEININDAKTLHGLSARFCDYLAGHYNDQNKPKESLEFRERSFNHKMRKISFMKLLEETDKKILIEEYSGIKETIRIVRKYLAKESPEWEAREEYIANIMSDIA